MGREFLFGFIYGASFQSSSKLQEVAGNNCISFPINIYSVMSQKLPLITYIMPQMHGILTGHLEPK